MSRLDELTRKELYKDIDKRTKKYSKLVKGVTYLGITKDYTIIMNVPSVTANPPTNYIVKINLAEFSSIDSDKTLTTEDKVRLAVDGDVKISCTCPAFKWWGYAYITSQLDSKEGNKQDIYPSVRNPKLEGCLCKHAYIASRVIGKYWKRIASDINKMNFIDK